MNFTHKNTMKWTEYLIYFEDIIDGKINQAPYDNPEYVELVKLNYSRIKRWSKSMEISDELCDSLESIEEEQDWILIMEPWCHDASNIAPVIRKIAQHFTKQINLEIQLRDSPPFLINEYLTDGNKAIPILIVRNKNGEDLFTWGPRPKACKELVQSLKKLNTPSTELKVQVQKWYNQDKGTSTQVEICKLEQTLVVIDFTSK